ncbi:hypothetical protein A0J61_07315, partial [Choanephora cucurbitarum]
MELFLKNNFKQAVAKFKPDQLDQLSTHVSKLALRTAFYYNKQVTEEQKNAMIAYWFALEEKKDVEQIERETREARQEIQELVTTNDIAAVDKMANAMLFNYNNLSHEERVVLKLSMSRIVCIGVELEEVYRKYIVDESLWSAWEKKKKELLLTEEKKNTIEEVLSGVVESAKKGINEGIKHVLTEQLALVNLNKRSDMRYELLQAASYILHNVEKWESQNERSEAEVVGQVNEMLKIVFNSSKLKIKIGEIGAACTRENRKSRETSFSGGSSSSFMTGSSSSSSKKNINARKIDLMIMGANDVELSICEFKAKDEYRSLTKQSGKCARLNQALLED